MDTRESPGRRGAASATWSGDQPGTGGHAWCSAHLAAPALGTAPGHSDKWRDVDGGAPVNASGKLVDGTALNGPASLRKALLDRREAFVGATSEKLLSYALGRRVEYFDMPTVRTIVRDAGRSDYRFSSLVVGIVRSDG